MINPTLVLLILNGTRQPPHAWCQWKMIWRWNSFSATNTPQRRKARLPHTEHPNSLPTSYCCPGQHKGVVSRVCFTSAGPIRLRSWMRLSQLCRPGLCRKRITRSTAFVSFINRHYSSLRRQEWLRPCRRVELSASPRQRLQASPFALRLFVQRLDGMPQPATDGLLALR